MTCLRTPAILALVAAPLAAQPATPDTARHRMMAGVMPGMMMNPAMMSHMMQMEQMMAPMMRGMAFTPDHLLAHKDSLALTAQQVTRLTALRDQAKAAHDAAAADAKTHMDGLAQAMQAAAPDTNAVKGHFQAAHAAAGKAQWAMLAAAAQAKALLTDAQRAKVQASAESMQARMHQH
jgi:hypothetical protein